jgi:hypothetical protein
MIGVHPGPRRLRTEAPDVSGKVNTDIQYIADRQTIINTVTAYSHCLDEGRWEEFFALYSEDAVFQTTIPEAGTIITNGKKVFREMVSSDKPDFITRCFLRRLPT